MPIQTSYGFSHDPLAKGMKGECYDERIVTCYSDEIIPVGIGLADGGEASIDKRRKVNIPNGTGFTFMGVSNHVHKETTATRDGLGVLNSTQLLQYEIGEDIPVSRKSVRMVQVVGAVDPTLPVYLYHTGANAGNFGGAVNANADLVTSCAWASSTTGAGFALLEINLP